MNGQPTSRYCFVCGRDNPFGLKMGWTNHPEEGLIRGTVTVPEHFNGYPGIVHGGVVAAILDETAGRAIMLEGGPDDLRVTLRLEVTYRRPTPTDTELTAIGRVVRHAGRRVFVEGELRLPDGTVTAGCAAVIVPPPDEIARSWEEERAYFIVPPRHK
jgi:uncharacterized protein (TIGR00369 family)